MCFPIPIQLYHARNEQPPDRLWFSCSDDFSLLETSLCFQTQSMSEREVFKILFVVKCLALNHRSSVTSLIPLLHPCLYFSKISALFLLFYYLTIVMKCTSLLCSSSPRVTLSRATPAHMHGKAVNHLQYVDKLFWG